MKEKKELENYIINKKIDLDKIVDDYTPYIRKIIQNLDSYIAGVTRNLVKERLKTLRYNIDIEQYQNSIEYSYLETYSQEREEIKELYNKINNLKENDIKIIKMFYYSNKSIKDIAKELKISEVNVKTKLHRIRKKIRQELRKGGF